MSLRGRRGLRPAGECERETAKGEEEPMKVRHGVDTDSESGADEKRAEESGSQRGASGVVSAWLRNYCIKPCSPVLDERGA